MHIVLFGGFGYIGQKIYDILEKHPDVSKVSRPLPCDAEWRLESQTLGEKLLTLHHSKPIDRVMSCTGRTHGKIITKHGTKHYATIDYLELPGKLDENIRDNLFGPLRLASICRAMGIHYTYLGTGCIYTSKYYEDNKFSVFQEDDVPNFNGSAYSLVKGYTDQLLTQTDLAENTLTLRIRLPIGSDHHEPRNTICKLLSYKQIHSVSNSVTCLHHMLPRMVTMMIDKRCGPYNMVQKGAITNDQILQLYQKHSNVSLDYEVVSTQDELKLNARRSNCVLSTDKLEHLFPDLETAEEAVEECVELMMSGDDVNQGHSFQQLHDMIRLNDEQTVDVIQGPDGPQVYVPQRMMSRDDSEIDT
jgi:dTDP-4-dehydrorhamnose reductase